MCCRHCAAHPRDAFLLCLGDNMGEIYEIHHICIHAKDLDESIAFYHDFFGFDLVGRESCEAEEYAMLRLGPSRLELIQPHRPKEEDFGDCGSITHIGLGVRDIDSVVDDLRARGVKFLSEEIEDKDEPLGGLRAIQLLGPADEHINLYEWKREI